MLPDNERRRPVARTAPEDNQLAGDDFGSDPTDLADLVAQTEMGLLAVVTKMSAASGRELLANAPSDIIADPTNRFIYRAICVCLDEMRDPIPLAIADAVRRMGWTVPPAFRGHLLSELYALSATAPPVACAEWVLGNVVDNHGRRRVEKALATIAPAIWHGNTADLAQILAGELTAALSAFSANGVTA